MVIMEKLRKTVFDTCEERPRRRATGPTSSTPMRLTWGGEFIHAAPWSVADQGKRNVSHGCVNLSPENAECLFYLTSSVTR